MKKLLLFFSLIFTLIYSCKKETITCLEPVTPSFVNEYTITMGAGYANDVFVDFDSKNTKIVANNNWDIAFTTSLMEGTILINDAKKVKLWHYNKSGATWESIDIAGLTLNENNQLHNSDTTWRDEGAFNRTKVKDACFDYGWASYNSVTHNVEGKNYYIIDVNGTKKKIFVEQKNGGKNEYYFKYADLEGQNEIKDTIKINNFPNKNFIYYSLGSKNGGFSREPDKSDWDIVFTQYYKKITGNPNPYVMGVLTNKENVDKCGSIKETGYFAAKYKQSGIDQASFKDYNLITFKNIASIIGYEWKTYDHTIQGYKLETDEVYFVKNEKGNIYKLFFTYFDSATGQVGFKVEKLM